MRTNITNLLRLGPSQWERCGACYTMYLQSVQSGKRKTRFMAAEVAHAHNGMCNNRIFFTSGYIFKVSLKRLSISHLYKAAKHALPNFPMIIGHASPTPKINHCDPAIHCFYLPTVSFHAKYQPHPPSHPVESDTACRAWGDGGQNHILPIQLQYLHQNLRQQFCM